MRRTPGLLTAVSLVVALLCAAPASADVVGPDPESCPDGSIPTSCHGGPFCVLETCQSNTDCDGGDTCQTVSLCTKSIDCGGLGGPSPTTSVLGPCDAGCSATCSAFQVCYGSGSTTSSSSTGAGAAGPTGAASGGGGQGGTGGSGGSGGGDDLAVTGCACSLPAQRTIGLAGGLLFVAGLLGLTGRRRPRSRKE